MADHAGQARRHAGAWVRSLLYFITYFLKRLFDFLQVVVRSSDVFVFSGLQSTHPARRSSCQAYDAFRRQASTSNTFIMHPSVPSALPSMRFQWSFISRRLSRNAFYDLRLGLSCPRCVRASVLASMAFANDSALASTASTISRLAFADRSSMSCLARFPFKSRGCTSRRRRRLQFRRLRRRQGDPGPACMIGLSGLKASPPEGGLTVGPGGPTTRLQSSLKA